MTPFRRFASLLVYAFGFIAWSTGAQEIVINEIHYDSPERSSGTQFIELHNPSGASVDISGWRFSDGIKYVFPSGSHIPAGGFALIAGNAQAFQKEFGFAPAGEFTGALKKRGEKLALVDTAGKTVDRIEYGVGFPWPTAAHGGGASIERMNARAEGILAGSWRSSGFIATGSEVATFIPAEDAGWRFRKGTSEASQPPEAWRLAKFSEDPSWTEGRTSIGYGDGDDHTVLSDMAGKYTSLFLRHRFSLAEGLMPATLLLRVRVDDGCIVWLNGHEIARLHMRAGEPKFDWVGEEHEAGAGFEEVLIYDAARLFVSGANLIAVEAFNASPDSSDLTIDLELKTPGGVPRIARPTPGTPNTVLTTTPPPAIRAVENMPPQPRANIPVTITAAITDSDGVQSATLHLQIVEPGRYIRKGDPSYEANWTSIPMHDDGKDGDTRAGDGVFTVVVPAAAQVHRRLVRYRISATDNRGAGVRVPYEDDDCPNFAYFVYNDAPAWTGAVQPGKTAPMTFPASLMTTLPSFHLLASKDDVDGSQWDGAMNKRKFQGAFVCDGKVYDHIEFHNRGQASTYVAGKNKWGFKFNRARDFTPPQVGGRSFKKPWDSISMNACASPWVQSNRGMSGLDEAAAFGLYGLAGAPSSRTFPVQLSVIDQVGEVSEKSQYDGDLWGLYLVVEEPDGSFLDQRGLPDGNVYRIAGGGGDRKHQGTGQSVDSGDWNRFIDQSRRSQPEEWWRANLDLPAYFAFHACNRLTGNVDLREGDNHYFYHRPDGRWTPIPWDLDMIFVPKGHQSGRIDQERCLEIPAIRLEYQNRCRELLDLLVGDATPGGGQVGQLVAEYAALVHPDGFPIAWPELDQCLWDFHPRTSDRGGVGQAVRANGQGDAEGSHGGESRGGRRSAEG